MYICKDCNGIQPWNRDKCAYCITGEVVQTNNPTIRTQRINSLEYDVHLYDIIKDDEIKIQSTRYYRYTYNRFSLMYMFSSPTINEVNALIDKAIENNNETHDITINKHLLSNYIFNSHIGQPLTFIETLSKTSNKRIFIHNLKVHLKCLIIINGFPALVNTRQLLSYLTIGKDVETFRVEYNKFLPHKDTMWQINLRQNDIINKNINNVMKEYYDFKIKN